MYLLYQLSFIGLEWKSSRKSALRFTNLSEFSEFDCYHHSLMSHLIKILKWTFGHRKEFMILGIYNKYENISKLGIWRKNGLKGLCCKIATAWRPQVKQITYDLGNLETCYITLIWESWNKFWSLGISKAHSEALGPDLPFLRKIFWSLRLLHKAINSENFGQIFQLKREYLYNRNHWCL